MADITELTGAPRWPAVGITGLSQASLTKSVSWSMRYLPTESFAEVGGAVTNADDRL